jgi:hypothetical protein
MYGDGCTVKGMPENTSGSAGRVSGREEQDRVEARDAARLEEHHGLYCPTCGMRLFSMRCKLICSQCGYYMSCADYY